MLLKMNELPAIRYPCYNLDPRSPTAKRQTEWDLGTRLLPVLWAKNSGIAWRVVQYSDKIMHGIVLYYIHLTKQYNRERSNTIDCNTMPCINLSEYWTTLILERNEHFFAVILSQMDLDNVACRKRKFVWITVKYVTKFTDKLPCLRKYISF